MHVSGSVIARVDSLNKFSVPAFLTEPSLGLHKASILSSYSTLHMSPIAARALHSRFTSAGYQHDDPFTRTRRCGEER